MTSQFKTRIGVRNEKADYGGPSNVEQKNAYVT